MIYAVDCGSRGGPGRVESESCVAVLNKKLFSAFFNPSGARFSKVLVIFRPLKLFYVCRVCIQDQSFYNFGNENNQLTKQN